MRAIRVHTWGGPEVLTLEDIPIPVPTDTQVLIKVKAVGVNPVDTYIRSGNYAYKPDLPYIPGYDAAGIVEAVGKKVTTFKKGDKAYFVRSLLGTYSEYAVADVLLTGHLSDNLSFTEGAGVGVPYYTAYRALVNRAKVRPAETVLVHGASGAVGLAGVQIAKAVGLRVLGTAGTSAGLKLVKDNGAAEVFNHRDVGYTEKILAATEGRGPDVILEMLSNVNLQHDLELIKPKGRIVVIGCRGTIEINPRLMMGKESQVLGLTMATAREDDWYEMHAFVAAGMAAGWLRPHISKEYPLEEATQAQNDVINNAGTLGRLVLTV